MKDVSKILAVAKSMTRKEFIKTMAHDNCQTVGLPHSCPDMYQLRSFDNPEDDMCNPCNNSVCEKCWGRAVSEITFQDDISKKESTQDVPLSRWTRGGVTRFALREGVAIDNDRVTVHYAKALPGTKVVQLLDSNKEVVGVDVHELRSTLTKIVDDRVNNRTIVTIQDKDGKEYTGVAECSKDDVYNPQIGYNIAYSRAMIKKHEALIKRYK